MLKVTGKELEGMIEHWLSTPINGYLGGGYGQDIKALLQMPHSDTAADQFIRKMVVDIPVLGSLPPSSIAIYGVPSGADRVDMVLEVAGRSFDLGGRD